MLHSNNIDSFEKIPLGAIIAKANIVDCIEITWNNNVKCIAGNETGNIIAQDNEWFFGNYHCEDERRFAWILEDIQPIKPIEAKGQLSLWNFDLES